MENHVARIAGRRCFLEIDALRCFCLHVLPRISPASRGHGGTNCNGGNYDTVRIKTGKSGLMKRKQVKKGATQSRPCYML